MVVAAEAGRGVSRYSGARRAISLALLLLVNLLPLLGVVLLDWDVLALMILYWSENLVLGFYTLVKMLVKSPLGGIPMGLFFTLHYGAFCGVHGLFILVLLGGGDADPMPEQTWPLFLVFLQLLVSVIGQVLAMAPPAWLAAFAALFISHGVSFLVNFLYADEKSASTVKSLMTAPYKRIVILHVAIIAGGMAVAAMGQPVAMLLALVLLKLGVDVALHVREHERP